MIEKPDLAAGLLALARRPWTRPNGFPTRRSGFMPNTVEKALKAAIASRDLEFPFTHDLGVLMQFCEDAGFELPDDLAEADRLTPYAAALRYGLGNPKPSLR